MHRFLLILSLGVAPTSGMAQTLQFNSNLTAQCLQNAVDGRDCIGVAANTCIQTSPGGDTTVGMTNCMDADLKWWDARLNRVYQDLSAIEKSLGQGVGKTAKRSGAHSQGAQALLQMQRAWIPFRDAAFAYEFTHIGGGSFGTPAVTLCMLHLTAEQTLRLERYLYEKQ